MSHFTVMVIGANVEEQLAPFQENNMGDCPKEYMEFNDQETEFQKEWDENTETVKEWWGGNLVKLSEEQFNELKNNHTLELTNFRVEIFCIPNLNDKYVVHHKKEEVYFQLSYMNELENGIYDLRLEKINPPMEHKLQDEYESFENFVKEYHGYKERHPVYNRYGYEENPNRKYDWYQVGGRWAGFFRLKSGTEGEVGQPSLLFDSEARAEINEKIEMMTHADQTLKKNIDFEGMRNDAGEKAAAEYDRVMKVIAHLPSNETWETVRERHGDDIDKARKEYNDQERVKALYTSKDQDLIWFSADDFLVTREEYVESARNSAIMTFALVKDGHWYERGAMGWFGCVSDEKDQNAWEREFNKLLDSVPDDTMITVVDCHI